MLTFILWTLAMEHVSLILHSRFFTVRAEIKGGNNYVI